MSRSVLVLLAVLAFVANLAAQPLRMYAESAVEYTVLRGDETLLQIGSHAWGAGWSHFGISGKSSLDPQGRRLVESQAKVPGGDTALLVKHTAAQAGERSAVLTYEMRAPSAAKLTQVVATIEPSRAFVACDVKQADGSSKQLKLPFARGPVGDAVQQLALREQDGSLTTIQIDPARPVSMDGQGRVQLVGEELAAGEARTTTLTLNFAAPLTFYADDKQTVQRDDTSNWFAYPTGSGGVPVDLSFLNKDAQGNFIPAGTHGFLKVNGDEFVFEDGTPARFWGVNLTAGAVLGSEQRAKQLADRLARLGVNIVRMHHLDSWANPIVDYKHPDGTTQHLNPASLKLLDRLVFELKQRGIYTVLDPWVQRSFKAADGVEDYGNLGKNGNFNLHPYIYFDRRMQELIQKQWHDVWTHANEFTGKRYLDEPACVMTEVINEGLLSGLSGVRPGPYRDRLKAIYETWAKQNNGLPWDQAKVIEQNYGANNIRFMQYLHEGFYRKSHDYFRSIGVKIPINYNNWAHWSWIVPTLAGGDFMDHHHYYGGDQVGPGSGMGGLWLEHTPYLNEPPFGKMAAFSLPGKPLKASECGNCPPKTYRAAYMVGLAAVASFQQWDSFTGYAYSQASQPMDRVSAFEWESDPPSVASLAAGALIFRRGDVAPARQSVAINVPEKEFSELRYGANTNKQLWNLAAVNASVEQHKVYVCLPGMKLPDGITPSASYDVESAAAYRHPSTELKSDTGELWRDWQIGVGTVDTPRTQVAYGRLGTSKKPWTTRDCSWEITTPFAVTAISSLDGAPISSSRKLLLTAAARAQNTGTAYNMSRTSIVEQGKAPVLAEPVVGTIRLKTSQPALAIYPLKVDGTRGEAVRLTANNGTVTIDLRPESKTIFYEIEAAN